MIESLYWKIKRSFVVKFAKFGRRFPCG